MPNYPALLTEISLPAYSGMTDVQVITAVNAKTVASPQKALISAGAIVNAIATADLAALVTATGTTGTNELLCILFALSGNGQVDASPGTTVRAIFAQIFAGKTTTLANLAVLVAPYDNATASWVAATIGIPSISEPDLLAARAT